MLLKHYCCYSLNLTLDIWLKKWFDDYMLENDVWRYGETISSYYKDIKAPKTINNKKLLKKADENNDGHHIHNILKNNMYLLIDGLKINIDYVVVSEELFKFTFNWRPQLFWIFVIIIFIIVRYQTLKIICNLIWS